MLKRIISALNKPDPVPILSRQFIAGKYIKGQGIEIGALHNPLPIDRKKAIVRYVDRMEEKALRLQYPELSTKSLVPVDYIADGELLESINDASQDFVIANHFIEHCQNTILTLRNMLRVLKPEGIIFLAVPDKRFTFDKPRSTTPLSHIVDDYVNGPENSRDQHFYDWAKIFNPDKDENDLRCEVKRLMAIDYSIHFHVWEKKDMDELLVYLVKVLRFDFEIELSLRIAGSNENIYIIRKGASIDNLLQIQNDSTEK